VRLDDTSGAAAAQDPLQKSGIACPQKHDLLKRKSGSFKFSGPVAVYP
jgi:hypothetical protein